MANTTTKTRKAAPQSNTNKGARPDYRVFSVPADGARWVEHGAAWKGKDGYINLVLNSLPIGTNRLVLQVPTFDD